MLRPHKVKELIDAATAAMEPIAEECSESEVLTAYFTMARNSVVAAKAMGLPVHLIKGAAEMILMECDDGRKM